MMFSGLVVDDAPIMREALTHPLELESCSGIPEGCRANAKHPIAPTCGGLFLLTDAGDFCRTLRKTLYDKPAKYGHKPEAFQ